MSTVASKQCIFHEDIPKCWHRGINISPEIFQQLSRTDIFQGQYGLFSSTGECSISSAFYLESKFCAQIYSDSLKPTSTLALKVAILNIFTWNIKCIKDQVTAGLQLVRTYLVTVCNFVM